MGADVTVCVCVCSLTTCPNRSIAAIMLGNRWSLADSVAHYFRAKDIDGRAVSSCATAVVARGVGSAR